jgi:hypothetical protein
MILVRTRVTRKIADAPEGVRHLTFKSEEFIAG